jgi:hypothetical protein
MVGRSPPRVIRSWRPSRRAMFVGRHLLSTRPRPARSAGRAVAVVTVGDCLVVSSQRANVAPRAQARARRDTSTRAVAITLRHPLAAVGVADVAVCRAGVARLAVAVADRRQTRCRAPRRASVPGRSARRVRPWRARVDAGTRSDGSCRSRRAARRLARLQARRAAVWSTARFLVCLAVCLGMGRAVSAVLRRFWAR